MVIWIVSVDVDEGVDSRMNRIRKDR